MKISVLDIIVVLVYLILIGGLGIYQARKIKGSGDYFAGGRKFNKFLMMMHSLGTGTHADDPVGVTGAAFEKGYSGIWYTFAYLFVTPFYWILAPLFRRSRFLTTSDFFEARFGSSLGILYTIMGVVTFTINIGTMLKGTGVLTSSITQGAVSPDLAVGVMAVIFVLYGTAGGLVATVITESIQGVLIVVMSLLLVPFGLMKIGGFSAIHNLLDPSKFNLSAPVELSIWWIIGATIMNLIGIVAQPHSMEVCATGKTEWEGRIGFTYGSFIKRFCALGWAASGVIVLALVANGSINPLAHREDAFGVAIRYLLPSGFIGLMFAAILAAQMSSLSAFMVAASALLSRNFYRRWLRPSATDNDVLIFARYSGLAVVAFGIAFAFVVPGVAEALTYFWAVTTFTGLFMWFGVLWKKTNTTGAWASFVVMVIIWTIIGPIGTILHKIPFFASYDLLGIYGDKAMLHYMLPSYLIPGIIALVIGSLLGKPMDKKKLRDFYLLLKTPVGREKELEEAGVEVVYAGNTVGHPWEMKHGTMVNVVGFIIATLLSLSFLGLLYLLARAGA